MLDLTSLAVALAAPAMLAGSQVSTDGAEKIAESGTELAAQMLMDGERRAALSRLEQQRDVAPSDPAVLINLGIAYAQMGYDDMARSTFKIALSSRKPEELATADGRTMDSRILARKALQMLDRGDFQPS